MILLSALLESLTLISVTAVTNLFKDSNSIENISSLNNQNLNFLFKYLPVSFLESKFSGLAIFAMFVCLSGLSRTYILWFNNITAAKVGNDLGTVGFSNILYWPYLKHLKNDSSELIASLTQFSKVSLSTINNFLTICTASIIAIFLSIILLTTNFTITIFIIFSIAFAYLLNSSFTVSILNRISRSSRDERINLIKIIQNSLGEIRDILLSNSQYKTIINFRETDFTLKKNAAYSKFISLYPRYVFDTVLILSIIFILSYQKNIELGNLAIFFFGSQKLLPLLQLMNSSFTAIKYGAAQTKDFLSIIKDIPNLKKSKRSLTHKNKNKKLRFNKLVFESIYFKYPGKDNYIISNFNLLIKKGEFISIVGPSGSGKSTILDILMGLIIPNKGLIKLDKEIILNNREEQDLNQWQSLIAHVPQKIFISNKSIAEKYSHEKL